jgi:glycosyltransferase involved in cell wall biosynthesis
MNRAAPSFRTRHYRIVHLYKDVYPPVTGGIEKHIAMIREALPWIQHDALVCGGGKRTRVRRDRCGHQDVLVAEFGRVLSTPLAPSYPIWLRRLAKDAILHLHMPQPLAELSVLISRASAPRMITYHADIYRQRALLPIYGPLMKLCLRSADRVITGSHALREQSPILRAAGIPVTVVPYGIDTSRWDPRAVDDAAVASVRRKYGNRFVISVGRLVGYKGFEYLVHAAQHLPCCVVIVGSGPLHDRLHQEVERHRLAERVHIIGFLPDDELAAHLAAASVFVLPSLNRAESFGISLIEAQAAGLPVVATDVGTGTTEAFVPGETGLAVRPADVVQLVAAIRQLLEDDEARFAMGRRGQLRAADRHSLGALARNLTPLYTELFSRVS